MNLKRIIYKVLGVLRPVFADLDGTLIETISGKEFPENSNDWKLKEGIVQALINYGCTSLIIVTNQGGIEKGFVNESSWWAKADRIKWLLESKLGVKVHIEMCPYNDETHPFRKPNPGMVMKWFDMFSPSECIMIGDASGHPNQFSDSDKKCAENAGVPYMDVEDFIEKYK